MPDDHPAPAVRLRSGAMPLYRQLHEAIHHRITSGEWAVGQQIPTIRELCQIYGVSHITVTQALDTLVQDGLVTRQQGKGVFVAGPKLEAGPLRLSSFTEEISRRGHVPSSRVLALRREPASAELAAKLDLAEGETLIMLERLRSADGQPVGVQKVYLSERLFPGLADTIGPIDSLYRVLQERYGVVPTTATETFEPICLDRATATLLEVRPEVPAFSVERITRDQHNRLIEVVFSVLRGDRYKVVLKLERL